MMNTDGSLAQQLTHDAQYRNWWPRISPDRKKILFLRRPAAILNEGDGYAQASLWVMNADGSEVTQLRAPGTDGWTALGHPEWSPDGTKIALFGGVGGGAEIFVTQANGRNAVQFTNRGGVNTDVSWSPDGSQLLFNGCPGTPCLPANYEIYVMNATPLSAATRLTNDGLADYDAYFSPDGRQIAWLVTVDPTRFSGAGAWAIRIADADGGNAHDLINDGNINSKPAWSLDGQTIFFHRMALVAPFEEGKFGVFSMARDGSNLRRLTSVGNGNNEHPSN